MRRSPLILPIVFALACQDYRLNAKDNDVNGGDDSGDTGIGTLVPDLPEECELDSYAPIEVGFTDHCYSGDGTFTPIAEWIYEDIGCLSMPVVGDLDLDGMPDIVVNISNGIGSTDKGKLVALRGDGSKELWSKPAAKAGYGSPPALADVDDDGYPEIAFVREYENSLLAEGDYTLVLWDHEGNEIWESDHFIGLDFDYATAPSIADMDNDGVPEITAGRVILSSVDGSTLGVGAYGRGSYGITGFGDWIISESSVSAIADLDLDGEQELITGNAAYAIDGTALWYDDSNNDGMVSIANMDDDPEGEIIAITGNTFRVMDTDGSTIWGPKAIPSGNILSLPAVADLDEDGYPEFVVAGGNEIWAVNHDGSILWTNSVTDESGATGASIFDFEGDGQVEVVYIDEVQMVAYDGLTGAVKFLNTDHMSNTMFDYPVIVDVDNDAQAEILVCHNGAIGNSPSMTVFGDQDESWMSARQVWNQHPYSISNINDDLTVPVYPNQGFDTHNTWHSGIASSGYDLIHDVEAMILDVCDTECLDGTVWVTVRLHNKSHEEAVPAGTQMTLYMFKAGALEPLETVTLEEELAPGWSTRSMVLELNSQKVSGADYLLLVADDDGTGVGTLDECSEDNNRWKVDGPFCQ